MAFARMSSDQADILQERLCRDQIQANGRSRQSRSYNRVIDRDSHTIGPHLFEVDSNAAGSRKSSARCRRCCAGAAIRPRSSSRSTHWALV